MRRVRCDTGGCNGEGVVRDIPDVRVAPGVVTRPELFCEHCGSALPDLDLVPAGRPRERMVTGPGERRTKSNK